ELGRARNRARDLDVRGVVAPLAEDDLVLAGLARGEVLVSAAAPHQPDVPFDLVVAQATAVEDAAVRGGVAPVARGQAFLVAVEAVGVLHDELAYSQQAPARPWLVTGLGAEVVPDLRQLPVGAELRRVERTRLLVREREHVRPPGAVEDLVDLGQVVAAGP